MAGEIITFISGMGLVLEIVGGAAALVALYENWEPARDVMDGILAHVLINTPNSEEYWED